MKTLSCDLCDREFSAESFDALRPEAYNGQQGDHWDAQKDMALALVGALSAIGIQWGTGPLSGR